MEGVVRVMSWQNVVLAGMLLAAVCTLQLAGGPENVENRSTVLALVSILGSWVASSRATHQVDQLRQEVAELRGAKKPD